MADSLKQIFNSGEQNETTFELLKDIVSNETDPDQLIKYSDLIIKKAKQISSDQYLVLGYLYKGYGLKSRGNLTEALQLFLDAQEHANNVEIDQDKNASLGIVKLALASTYRIIDDIQLAEKYYQEGIEELENTNDRINLARAFYNYGDFKLEKGDYDESLELFNKAKPYFDEFAFSLGLAYIQGNMGIIYAYKGNDSLGLSNINESVTQLEKWRDYYAASDFLLKIANIYLNQENFDLATKYADRSLLLSQQYGLKKEMSDANFMLSKAYEAKGENARAYPYFKSFVAYKDSISSVEVAKAMADIRLKEQQKQAALEMETQKRTNRIVLIASIIVIALILAIAIGLFRRNKFIRSTSAIIEREKSRSDNLLLNILPAETAKELKDKGRVAAKRFDNVSVLFTDFKGFTLHSEHLSPEDLVKTVDFYFSKFDAIIDKYELEKIKTIGDAYMCASGLPFEREDHAERIVKAAMEIVDFVEFAKTNNPDNHPRFEVRVGIHSGQVVAGVVGRKKFAYDIWGDTVNTAARMETSSEDGRINISEDTYALVKDTFNCKYRGKIDVKNKGSLKMYFVNGYVTEPEPSLVNHQSDNA